ncbi:MAG: hypothetical protein RL660_1940 [Bacteroidota bacterium]|jgi:hypothetical protein
MRKLLVFLLLVCAYTSQAQQVFPTYRVSEETDTIEVIQLNEIIAIPNLKFSDDTARYKYNQMKYYMKSVYPYAVRAVALFNEIDAKTANMSGADRRKYIKSREADIKREFDSKIKKLNVTQGRYLIRMINRNASMTCFDIINELHNPIKANAWQAWARMNGMDLDETYNPEVFKQFERIMKSLEQ